MRAAAVRARLRLTTFSVVLALGATLAAAPAHATTLPDGRGYELVSFPNTDGASPGENGYVLPLGDDSVLWSGLTQPIGVSPSGASPLYLAQRTASGWQSTQLAPPGLQPDQAVGNVLQATDNGAVVVRVSSTVLGDPNAPPEESSPNYVELRTPDGSWHELVADADPATQSNQPSALKLTTVSGMSADGSAVAFTSWATPPGLTPDADLNFPDAYLYDDGSVRRLSDDSGVSLAGCDVTVAGNSILDGSQTTNALSADASTVFLEAQTGGSGSSAACPPFGAPQVYVDHDGSISLVSTPTDGATPPTSAAEQTASFVGASPDGTTAYFISGEQLTTDASGGNVNLYRWQAAAGSTPATVSCVSCDAGAGATSNVQDVLVSPTGDYVWFSATAPVQGVGPTGQRSIFVLHDGTIRYVAPDEAGDGAVNADMNHEGDVLVYPSGPIEGEEPLYRAVDGADGVSTECVSCTPDGTPEVAFIPRRGWPVSDTELLGGGSGSVSDDGDTIPFTSSSALAPGSTSGDVQVYRWQQGEGVALIADQSSTARAPFITPDGADLFFQSSDVLVPGTDGLGTAWIYDARIGGGFPAPPTPAGGCSGDACQGPLPASPAAPVVASGSPTGAGSHHHPSQALPAIPQLRVPALSAATLRALAVGRNVTLTIRARGRGVLRVQIETRETGSRHLIASGEAHVRSAQRARTIRIRVRLTAGARRALGHRRRLAVQVIVTLRGARAVHMNLILTDPREHR